jgi:hypothetical protein
MGSSFGNSYTLARKRYIPKVKKHEEELQLKVCKYLKETYPEVVFRSDYASGLHLTMNQASKHKRMQSSKSWPDLFIYKPMQHPDKLYYGLALELKKEGTSVILKIGENKGKLSSNEHIREQALMLKSLNSLGYYANFAVGFDSAKKIIDWYMLNVQPENTSIF